LACDLDTKGKVLVAYLIGELEPAQRATFDAICEVGAISAPELATRFASLNIGPTAWNNRLSTLANKGLLIERRQGKTKSFSPLLEIA
jgi:AraC-like DNA-binding protein